METTQIREKRFVTEKAAENHTRIRPVNAFRISIAGLVFKYGLIAGACFILSFFFFKMAGLIHVMELSLINFAILAVADFFALRKLRSSIPQRHRLSYIKGLGTGFFIGVVSFLTLSAFMLIYLTYIDVPFMKFIQSRGPSGVSFGPFGLTAFLLMHGSAIGAIISLVMMQYFKKGEYPVLNEKTGDSTATKPGSTRNDI